MDAITHKPRGHRIVKETKDIPAVELVYPLSEAIKLPPLSGDGQTSKGLYLAIANFKDQKSPAVIKLLGPEKCDIGYELEMAQANSCLGVSPRL